MKGPAQEELVTEAAFALAEWLFDRRDGWGAPVVDPADAHWLLTGRLDLWDQWESQSPALKGYAGELLRYRSNDLASDKHFHIVVRRLLERGDAGYRAARPPTAPGYVEAVHGRTAELHVKTLLGAARRRHLQSLTPRPFAETGNYHPGGRLETTIAIPLHTKPSGEQVEVVTAAEREEIRFTTRSLLRFAAALDRAAAGKKPWRYRTLKRLFDGLRDRNSAPVTELGFTAGEIQQLIAPTGVGKTVLIREFAVLLAACGATTGIVIGNINETLSTLESLREIAAAIPTLPPSLKQTLGIVNDHPCIAPMISPKRLHGVAVTAAGRGQWDRFDEIAYGCDMTGWTVDGPAPTGGHEPCTTLTAVGEDGQPGPARTCPRILQCGKGATVRAAATADLIVTYHHNFLLGNVQVPLTIDGEHLARCSTLEFVLRRCQIVLIDEVDRAKSILFDADANELTLAVKGGANAPLTDLNTARRSLPAGLDRGLHPALARTSYLAEQLLNYVLVDELRFEANPERPESGWRLPSSNNRLLQHALGLRPNDQTPPDYATFDALFPDYDPEREPARAVKLSTAQERLARLLAQAVSNEGADNLPALKFALSQALRRIRTELVRDKRGDQDSADLELPSAVELLANDQERANLVNHLLVRTWLGSLHQSMTRLTYETTKVAQAPAVRDVLPQLRTYARHSPVPFGPIGYLLFGFRIERDRDRPEYGKLSTQAISGDPHTTVTRLGDIVALTYAGHRRIVVGLSATAYFPGAVREHLDVVPTYTMTDAVPGAFRTGAGQAMDANSKPFKIGGELEQRKPALIEELGANLWHQRLDGHLRRIAEDDPDRERSLLAVNSYKHAGYLALGLAQAVPDQSWIAVVEKKGSPLPVALPAPVARITIEQIEDLPRTHPAVKIIVAPLNLVARGLNILIPDSDRSALSSLWVAVRPPMGIDAPAAILAHVTDYALRDAAATPDPAAALLAQRTRAHSRLYQILNANPKFTRIPRDLKAEAVAGMIVNLIQLGGRARRGSTPVELYLSDDAFHDETLGSDLASLLAFYWDNRSPEQQAQMRRVYGETLRAWLDFANIT